MSKDASFFVVGIFSCLFVLKPSSLINMCNFSDRFGGDVSLWHQCIVQDFIVVAVPVQTEWADDTVQFLFFPCVFIIHLLFTDVLPILPIHIEKKSPYTCSI